MNRRQSRGFVETACLLLLDGLAIGLAYRTAYRLRFETDIVPFIRQPSLSIVYATIGIVIVCFLAAFMMNGLYTHRRSLSPIDEAIRVVGAVSIGTLFATAVITFALRGGFEFSRLTVAYAWVLTIVLVSIDRAVFSLIEGILRSRGIGIKRVLIVGSGDSAHIVLDKIRRSPQLGYEVIGFIDENGRRDIESHPPILGGLRDIGVVVEKLRVDTLIVALTNSSPHTILDVIDSVDETQLEIKVFPDVVQMITRDAGIDDLAGLPLVALRPIALRGANVVIKRITDIAVSSIMLVAFSWLMMLIALLIKLESRGPVFYIQERVGKDGRAFPCIKFRSMVDRAEEVTGPVWAHPNDNRRTRLGGFLRRHSLDELPQFINVLLGHMSVVGPRPERPAFVRQFSSDIPRYMDRHAEKAGITGWAQVNGLRGNTSIEERTKYDLYYVENWSLVLDLKIMLKTLAVLFTDQQAY